MLVIVWPVTTRLPVPEIEPRVAVMTDVPAATAVARPPVALGPGSIVPTVSVAEVHVTRAVMSIVTPAP